jgi:hypothetical protein
LLLNSLPLPASTIALACNKRCRFDGFSGQWQVGSGHNGFAALPLFGLQTSHAMGYKAVSSVVDMPFTAPHDLTDLL